MTVQRISVGPGYFETLGISLTAGRPLNSQDTEKSSNVAVINETMAKNFFRDTHPIGKRFGFGDDQSRSADIEIVGVARDAKYKTPRDRVLPMVFLPFLQDFDDPPYSDELHVRTIGDPTSLASDVRRVVSEIDKRLLVLEVRTLNDQVAQSVRREQTISELSGFFGVVAVLLACIGLYGTMAYAVVRRTKEIGIRLAVGGQRSDVLWLILRETVALVAAGLAIGIAAAIASGHLVSSMLFGLQPNDPLTVLTAAVLLFGIGLLAGYIPARRASKIDPIVALRDD